LFFFFFSFFIVSVLYAKNKATYRPANRLIRQKKQDLAIDEIIDMLENHPESLNRATDSIKKAMQNQELFAQEFLKIISQLYKDPDNLDRILYIIANLEKLNTAMEPQMQNFLQNLKGSSLYAANRIKFNKIMKEGVELIKEGKYADASAHFMQGYAICYAAYNIEYAQTERLRQTKAALASIKDTSYRIKREEPKFNQGLNAYRLMLRQDFLSIDNAIVQELEAQIKAMNAIAGDVFANGTRLNEFLAEDKSKEGFKEDSFLPYSTRITMGRSKAEYYEGVQGAADAAVLVKLEKLQDYILSLFKKTFENAFEKFRFGHGFPIPNVEKLKTYIEEYERCIKWVEGVNSEGTQFALAQDSAKEKLIHVSSIKKILDDTLVLYNKFFDINGHVYKDRDFEKIENINELNELASILVSIDPINSSLQKYSFETMNNGKQELLQLHLTLFQNIEELFQTRLQGYAELKNGDGKDFFEENEEAFNEAKKLVEGVRKTEFVSRGLLKYPTEALSQFAEQEKKILSDIKILQDATKVISSVPKNIDSNSDTQLAAIGIRESIQKLSTLLEDLRSAVAVAKDNVFKMNLAKQEAEYRYNEAVKQFRNNEFESARVNVTRSQTKSNDALTFEDNDEYRKLVDERLSLLGEQINQKENEEVVKEVRSSLEKAKKLYFNGNFGEAESILTSAKNRWHTTNIDENEELQNWISITQTASVMKTGRTIPQSATLYPQMSQLISTSKQLFNEAARSIKAERKEALGKLNEARGNLRQVLLVYPLNEEAGQLNLRIDQLIDPENFTAQVRKKISQIQSDYRRSPQTYYAELLNLYIMDRNFPGIAKLKDEVEIYLGIKLIPPDTSAIDQSLALTNEADAIFKSGNKAKYAVALQRLNQAIKLNPNNERASLLKDRVQMAMGGSAIAVLSYANEEKYRRAILALQKGNKITAIALVEELLRDPEGRKSAKVHNLKKRINAQL